MDPRVISHVQGPRFLSTEKGQTLAVRRDPAFAEVNLRGTNASPRRSPGLGRLPERVASRVDGLNLATSHGSCICSANPISGETL
ncbi:phage-related hypothetical protein [Bordetella bronchiseptica RB50]|uniref:Uncharacterized protein n=1 Tax=Bordetella bronchiseptica (strain ATCC BAA-588 / NCTC 13252 / RB50) TaxID=257310 RepID=A0A0H3LTY9_BORBR|nr:phage-related hypothetical protein [Bordetella bronchiseptica RB50]